MFPMRKRTSGTAVFRDFQALDHDEQEVFFKTAIEHDNYINQVYNELRTTVEEREDALLEWMTLVGNLHLRLKNRKSPDGYGDQVLKEFEAGKTVREIAGNDDKRQIAAA